ncbi:MAG: T9SS type A sorting domain-containing protein [Chitinophagaceae bacterium]
MTNNLRSCFLIMLMSTSCSAAFAQEVVNAGGADATGSGGQVNYSIGQAFYTVVNDAGGSMQQGIQAIVIDQVLPVTLLDFQLRLETDNRVLLSWRTAMEQHNDRFILEKSTDSRTFRPFAQVKGKGYATSVTDYAAHDNQPATGLNFYRIRQQDFDGTIAYSEIKSIRVLPLENTVTLSPNPTAGMLILQTKQPLSKTYQILDLNGRILESRPVTSGNMQIDISRLNPAMYIINIIHENKTVQSFKITKN